MAWCERSLSDHVECAKAFIREAREKDLVYSPGSFDEHDRCASTRLAYFECTNDPSRKGTEKLSAGQESHAPIACEKELNVHGKCVERYLKSATAQSKATKTMSYPFLSHTGEDRCLPYRTSFEQCLTMSKEIASGKRQDPTKGVASVTTRTRSAIAMQY